MEKIYMENNNNNKKQSTFQQVFKSKLSSKLSISMVLVAFFSFLMIGVGNVSYAAPTEIPEDIGLGDSFTTKMGSQITGYGGTSAFPVFMYSTDKGIPIFCLERDVAFKENTVLKKAERIDDLGLLYVMANSYPHVKFKDTNGKEFPDGVQTWITQAAIWQYLYETGHTNNGSTSGDSVHIVSNISKVYQLNVEDSSTPWCDVTGCYATEGQASNKTTFYQTYIAGLVANAKQATAVNGTMVMTKANDEISMTDDEKYYQTSLITVSNTDPTHYVSSTVEIKEAPEGTILVDENGQEIKKENYTNLSKFYVRIPANKVTEENKTIKLSVTGKFRGYDGYYYRAAGAQTVSTVFTTDVPHNTGLELTINYTPDVPDTGMSVAQSIYFIGLIVLLCGVGIIYANARPKAKQQ